MGRGGISAKKRKNNNNNGRGRSARKSADSQHSSPRCSPAQLRRPLYLKVFREKCYKQPKNNTIFRITKKNFIFLHCLPRGNEVSEDVFLSKNSHVWQQAFNRVHVQKSILLYCFGKLR